TRIQRDLKTEEEQKQDSKIGAIVNSFKNQEEVQIFRKKHRIRVYGTDIPYPFRSFQDLVTQYEIKLYLQKNLQNAGYSQPTPIQIQSIPVSLHGRDLMAMAPTGSGKTLAYLLPILHDLKGPEKMGYRALIISPTRELAQQIYREIKKLSIGKKFKICMLTKASAATIAQAPHLRQKFDILISTPLRLVHAITEENIELKNVRHLILDEADKLLELGFLEQTDEIINACSNPRIVKSLYSATLPSGVESLANTIMKDPIRVVVGVKNAATETIKQKLLFVGQEEGKLIAIRQQIQQGLKPPVLIFVQSIERAKELFHELIYDGINVDVIHAERTKAQRDSIVLNFMQGKIWVLIATELMARGMDFKGVNLVVNYDFPQSVQSYIHRIGRTGRAGRNGEAVTYFTKDDAPFLKSIVNVMKESGCEVPDWMLTLKPPSQNAKKQVRRKPIDRRTISTVSKYDLEKIKRKKEIVEASKKRKSNTVGDNQNIEKNERNKSKSNDTNNNKDQKDDHHEASDAEKPKTKKRKKSKLNTK
ncbi:1592_t:CDS:10, partial [Ambispora leptoticha]